MYRPKEIRNRSTIKGEGFIWILIQTNCFKKVDIYETIRNLNTDWIVN